MSETLHDIYLITNRTNMKCYVGQAKQIISDRNYGTTQRWNSHCNRARNNSDRECAALENAIRKYGKNAFTVETIYVCNDQEADIMEVLFIKVFNSLYPNGYNLDTGGCKNKQLSDSTKDKLSRARSLKHLRDEDRIRVQSSMRQLNISQIPRGIWYKRPDKRGMEGFIVSLKDHRKQFSAKSLPLVEKLKRALEYLESNIKGPDALKIEQNKHKTEQVIMSSNQRKKIIDETCAQALIDNNLEHLPMYVHYNKTYKRFSYATHEKGTYRSFKASTPSESLAEALRYLAAEK